MGKQGLDEPTNKKMATASSASSRNSTREPPNTAAGRRGANYTSLNLQYKGARPDPKGFGMWCVNVDYRCPHCHYVYSVGPAKGGHGMQSLGKVVATSRRMPSPASLPSLRSENAGNDPTVALVPSGGGGWKKDKEDKENQREDDDDTPPTPPPQRLVAPPPQEEAAKGGGNKVPQGPPPQYLRHPPPPPNPGKQFKANFPSLEEQETMSKKDVEELHRRGGGSPEPTAGKWRQGMVVSTTTVAGTCFNVLYHRNYDCRCEGCVGA